MYNFPLGMYLTFLIFLGLVAYAGIDEVMKLITYFDLNLRYLGIKIQMFFMKKKLERELNVSIKKWETYLEENENV